MSQHELEDTVADSVRVLHEHHHGDDHRDLFVALYAFQAGFDCGFTHGRVLDILVARRFTYRLPITDVRRGEVVATNPFTCKPVIAPEDRVILAEPTVAELGAQPDAVALRELARRVDAIPVHYDHRPPRELWSEAEAWFWG